MPRIRLDVLLSEKKLAESRSRAVHLIKKKSVSVDGRIISDPSRLTDPQAEIAIAGDLPFVGRGGEKLASALAHFQISPDGFDCLDLGASTGGFTDCLLRRGAKHVTAVDVGYGQLHPSLAQNPKVTSHEKINARQLPNKITSKKYDLIAIDLSFISISLILPNLPPLIANKGIILSLIKPQFELSPAEIGKKGIVKDPLLHGKALEKIAGIACATGLTPSNPFPCPTKGSDGNQEFFILMRLPLDPTEKV